MEFTEKTLRDIAVDVCKGKATAAQNAFVMAFYRKVFKSPFSQCHCQLCDAIFLILNKINRMNSKFKLKKGVVLRQVGKPYRLTHKTLTDELAAEHLEARPEDVKFFDVVPAKYKKKADKLPAPPETEPETPSEEAAQATEEAPEEPADQVEEKPPKRPARRNTRKKKADA